jgi:hypothetical protein
VSIPVTLTGGDGIKTAAVTGGKDAAGNTASSLPETASILLDTTGPTITAGGSLPFDPADATDLGRIGSTSGNYLTLTDAGAGGESYNSVSVVYSSDSSTDTLSVESDGTIPGIDITKLVAAADTATLTLTAEDSLGNSSTSYIQVKRITVTVGDPSTDFTVTGPQDIITFSAAFSPFSFFSMAANLPAGGGRSGTASQGNRSGGGASVPVGASSRSGNTRAASLQAGASTRPNASALAGRAYETIMSAPAASPGTGRSAVNVTSLSYETVREIPAARTGNRRSSPAARNVPVVQNAPAAVEREAVNASALQETAPRQDDVLEESGGEKPGAASMEFAFFSPAAPAFTGIPPVPAPVNLPEEPREGKNIPVWFPFINNTEGIPVRRFKEEQDQD